MGHFGISESGRKHQRLDRHRRSPEADPYIIASG
jgi:hypothetical protein